MSDAYRLLENGFVYLLEGTAGARILEGSTGSALLLPGEFTAVLIDAGNTDPFFIDAEQTARILTGNADPFGIDPERTTVVG